MDTREIYGKIFDITNNNMLENDMELEYSKEAFLFSTECPVGKCDVLDMIELDNMSFMEATYAALFFRTADLGRMLIGASEKICTRWISERG